MSEGNVDLLVLGGGMAGLAAAARIVQEGGSAVLVEKGDAVGGSATYAEFIWTAPDIETLRERNPNGDLALAETFIAGFEPAVQWVRDLGIEVQEPVDLLNFGRGYQTDLSTLFLLERRLIEDGAGSELLLEAEPVRLLIGDGGVEGAEVRLASGGTREIQATTTLLAMGGFAASRELRARHLGAQAAEMPLRANPHSAGRGLELAEAAGAAFGGENAGFYGHLWASGVPVTDPLRFAEMTFYHSEHGVLLNLEGGRFLDETIGDQLNAIALLDQPQARCLLVYDEFVHREWMMKPYVQGVEPFDKFEAVYKAGGSRCAIAHDLGEFAELPEEWGYPAETVHAALVEFNRRAAAGESFDPPRTVDARPLDEPPYYVVEVIPAITFTMGGILIDPEARALDADGEPIPGLLAAGGDAGGLYHRAYAGGLAAALVFGLRAAETARARAGTPA
jgi:succinate dehydrogenase/fumarate reductase flavoprotein subunit